MGEGLCYNKVVFIREVQRAAALHKVVGATVKARRERCWKNAGAAGVGVRQNGAEPVVGAPARGVARYAERMAERAFARINWRYESRYMSGVAEPNNGRQQAGRAAFNAGVCGGDGRGRIGMAAHPTVNQTNHPTTNVVRESKNVRPVHTTVVMSILQRT